GAVNQDFFTGLYPRQVFKRVVNRKEGRWNRGRGGKANAFRQRGNGVLAGDNLIAEAGGAEANHRLARCYVGDVTAYGLYDACELKAQGRSGEAVLYRFIG